MENNNIELRSEEVKEILGHIPSWLIRWGITTLFLVIFVLLIGSWFFKYPDVVNAEVVLTTENPPVDLIARTSGQISHLFVNEKDTVRKDEIVGVIENTANYSAVLCLDSTLGVLKDFLVNLKINDSLCLNDSAWNKIRLESLDLGELQSYYNSFIIDYFEYKQYCILKLDLKRIEIENQKLNQYQKLKLGQNQQILIQQKQLKLAESQFNREKNLFSKGIISKKDYERSTEVFLQQQFSYESGKSAFSNLEIQITGIEQNLIELNAQYEKNQENFQAKINEKIKVLESAIASWKQNFLLITPINGIVNFSMFWTENQNVKAGERVLSILPFKESTLLTRIYIPMQGAGKVHINDKVNIKFEHYPYMEYGIVEATITEISEIPEKNIYVAEAKLTNNLITTYGKQLKFSQQMTGSAEIITEDIRLIVRFLNPLKSMLLKNT